MFWLGLLRAFTSNAQTPIVPKCAGGNSASFIELAAVLPLSLLGARLDDRVDERVPRPWGCTPGPFSGLHAFDCEVWVLRVLPFDVLDADDSQVKSDDGFSSSAPELDASAVGLRDDPELPEVSPALLLV